MFLLIHYDDFEDIRELIDYDPLPMKTCTEEPDSETENEDSSSSESAPSSDAQYIAIKVAPQTLHNVPYGIITTKSWDALTFYIWIERRWRTLPVSAITDDLTHDSIIEAIELNDPTDLRVDYDTHWDCYCKIRDVCGCGCDPLHDGW